MKRSAQDVIRRGFDNTLANWPLIVIRVVESIVGIMLGAATLFAAVIPVMASAGLSDWSLPSGADPRQAVADLLLEHFTLFFYLLVLLFVVFGIWIAIHSFVTAGCVAVLVDGERNAGASERPPREAYRAYLADRFFAAARAGWWPMFWLYNATWSVAMLIILVPAIPILIGTIAFAKSDNVAGAVAVGCGGIALLVLIFIPVALVVAIWTVKATILAAGYGMPLRPALREGWRRVRTDAGRHFGVGIIMIAIMFGASALISGFAAPFSLASHQASFAWMLGPQVAVSMFQSVVSNAIAIWFLATFAAMTEAP